MTAPPAALLRSVQTSFTARTRPICPLLSRAQVWWVQRTLYSLVLERRIPFRVVSPLCDWDADNNRCALAA